uniref:Pepsin-I3 domain-containing protein n=1 Tax=Heterorhabditis bacteriophora TaxID=37862 RepID=A0A1I7XM03_HETBA
MVFSVSAVSTILSGCSCPTSDSPDDMIIGEYIYLFKYLFTLYSFLGLCAKALDVPILHNSAFHQARANDYAKAYLRKTAPISFHKFEDIDPYQDYMEYLHETYRTYNNVTQEHLEL